MLLSLQSCNKHFVFNNIKKCLHNGQDQYTYKAAQKHSLYFHDLFNHEATWFSACDRLLSGGGILQHQPERIYAICIS